ncbi:MAG: phosphatidate cytidylyltransferase [Winogradskyella sp.]|uniref:phosphatidate cytidylyltransferase n=1 Tax=Winogradskyella sp. TaxID=1883156 RepID=UPI0025D57C6F|nr:phosphatidate cytidylyltransferase [Winogradskyella sp.]NRB58419.1 phosphatidate cytidylyltransferase [Winogradskyella sp.]
MKELFIRTLSGIVYAALLIMSLLNETALVLLFAVFGFLSLIEFSKLIKLKSYIQYIIFIVLYFGFCFFSIYNADFKGSDEAVQILLVISIFVNLLLLKDLFTSRKIPLFESKRYVLTTFYLSSSFIFLLLIAHYHNTFSPLLLLGSFILIWINDSGAYMVGKNLGKQKLFPSISPKKTVEGFLGGLFIACVSSYFIFIYTATLSFTSWLILAITVSVLGTFGDLIESKFKRQAEVKDSGVLMPGHGGILDRLDSIIFASPFIYLFLRIISSYVS